MVVIDTYQRLVRLLELYLLKQTDNKLPTQGYSLIGLIPISPDSSDYQTLLLSAPGLSSDSPRWEGTFQLLTFLQKGLSQEEYQEVYNIDFIDPSFTTVRRLAQWMPEQKNGVFHVPISIIGGVTPQTVIVLRSSVLQHLTYYQPLKVSLNNGQVIMGKLTGLEEFLDNIILHFESNEGEKSCSFLDIDSVS